MIGGVTIDGMTWTSAAVRDESPEKIWIIARQHPERPWLSGSSIF
jgi:hypothetical protein